MINAIHLLLTLGICLVYSIKLEATPFTNEERELVERYAPKIWLHPDEKFFPSSTEFFLNAVDPTGAHKYSSNIDLYTAAQVGDFNNPTPPFLFGNTNLSEAPIYAYVRKRGDFTDIIYATFYPYNGGKSACDVSFNFKGWFINPHIVDPFHPIVDVDNTQPASDWICESTSQSSYFFPLSIHFTVNTENPLGNHVTDTEYFAVRLYKGKPISVVTGAHGEYQETEWTTVEKVSETHAVIYSALGGHGTHLSDKKNFVVTAKKNIVNQAGIADIDLTILTPDITKKGHAWDTWNNVQGINWGGTDINASEYSTIDWIKEYGNAHWGTREAGLEGKVIVKVSSGPFLLKQTSFNIGEYELEDTNGTPLPSNVDSLIRDGGKVSAMPALLSRDDHYMLQSTQFNQTGCINVEGGNSANHTNVSKRAGSCDANDSNLIWDPVSFDSKTNAFALESLSTGKCIDIGDNNDLQIFDCHDGPRQKFQFEILTDGLVKLKSINSANACVGSNGNNLIITGCSDTNVETFSVIPVSFNLVENISYKIQSVHDQQCLDIENASTDSGANVQTFGCHNQLNQAFKFNLKRDSQGEPVYQIIGVQSDKCLDVYNSSTASGANIQLYSCTPGLQENQAFRAEVQADRTYMLKPLHSTNENQCVDASLSSNNVSQHSCHGSNNQKWVITPLIDFNKDYEIKSVGFGDCLDVAGGSTSNNSNVQRYPCQRSDNQRWNFKKEYDDHGQAVYKIRGKQSGKCLDVFNASSDSGANIQLFSCSSGYQANQAWKLEVQQDGAYVLKPQQVFNQDQCMSSDSSNNNISQNACQGGNNQTFYINEL
ncbi:RICIN domain-containing protein [Pleionea sp. CnH1-48]|nr:RICIN domain-containing protein [Pleionea sp. CnH1-48]